jgi:hypothetical protein
MPISMKNRVKKRLNPNIIDFIRSVPKKCEASGKGIIVCSGDRHFISSYILVKMIIERKASVNIEWYYVGSELSYDNRNILLQIKNIRLIDCLDIRPNWFKYPINEEHIKGYMIKSYAIMVSKFRDIILLDGDNIPLQNVLDLFDLPTYRENGHLFWPDFTFSENNGMNKSLLPYGNDVFKWFNVKSPQDTGNRLTESGQIMIDKVRYWKIVCLAYFLNYNHDLTYKILFGDKDLYYLAFAIMRNRYNICKFNPYGGGTYQDYIDMIIQRHPENGEPLFMHRTLCKISMEKFNRCYKLYVNLDMPLDVKDKLLVMSNRQYLNSKNIIEPTKSIIESDLMMERYHEQLISLMKDQYTNNIKNSVAKINKCINFKNTSNRADLFQINDSNLLRNEIETLSRYISPNDQSLEDFNTLLMLSEGEYEKAIKSILNRADNGKFTFDTPYIYLQTFISMFRNKEKVIMEYLHEDYIFYLASQLYYKHIITIDTLRAILISSKSKHNKLFAKMLSKKSNNCEEIMDELLNTDIPVMPHPIYICFFYELSFRNKNNKSIRQKISKYHRRLSPILNYLSPHCKNYIFKPLGIEKSKIKIGFISTNFKNHSVSRDRSGTIERLDRELFDVTIFYFSEFPDHKYYQKLRKSDSKHIFMGNNYSNWIQNIECQQLDILVYCDISMHMETYILAHMRLAPIQITTWGHSETSGISTIDYYISSERYEIDDAENHYSEKLIKCKSLCTYYEDKYYEIFMNHTDNYDLKLIKNYTYLTCLQYLHKITDHDINIFKKILRNTSDTVNIVFIHGSKKDYDLKNFLSKFSQEDISIKKRLRIYPTLRNGDFYRLIKSSYLILDTYPHGGCNSTLECIYFNKLVITQPSKYLRGRFTKAFYERMGIIDGIALSSDEYANKVIGFVEIEDEIEKLSKIEERIYDNRHLVFNDDHSVTEWDNILLKLYIKMPKNIEE